MDFFITGGDSMADNVRSVERMFDLLEILAEERSPIGLTELAERTSLSKTTVHRLLHTLCSRQYAEKTSNSKYFLGPKVIELASYHISHLELHRTAMPFLAELYTKFRITVYLGKVVQEKVIFIELMDRNVLHDHLSSDSGLPAYPSGIGKCLLAAMSGDELDEMMYQYPLRKYTDRTITDVNEYKQHLKMVRSQGWAINDEETVKGMRFVAAPIYDFTGSAIAGISIGGTLMELPDDKLHVLTEAVVETADAISKRMGYLP